MELSHTWQGHGSAIFLEFGTLTPRVRHDGCPGNPDGEFGVMIEWSWRIEDKRSIICGSWSDEALWEAALRQLHGSTVTNVGLFGQLPELFVELSNGHRVLSFMTSEGNPEWALFDRRSAKSTWLCIRQGLLVEEVSAA
ncbi:MAG TPA: hypothetical protein VFC56_08595 [Stellaceae bacterium]|nr:hypothetical protein [Stellaceae bacterium]